MALLTVTFPGGKQVDSTIKGFTIKSDQPIYAGGEGTAPTPFEGFLASLGNCAGIFALGFCESKGLDTTGLSLTMDVETHPETRMVSKIIFGLTLPENFPEKYIPAIKRSIDLCSVKKLMHTPPEFETVVI